MVGSSIRSAAAALLVTCMVTAGLSGCSDAHTAFPGSTRVIQVVAAESFWGSIAAQLGGPHVNVTSIVSAPNADPHSYEPTAADARAVAFARMVIVNGVGYDAWMPHLLAAAGGAPVVLTVGRLLHVPEGGNPHRWYNPADVQAVISAMVADFSRLDPADAAGFQARRQTFDAVDLHAYDAFIASIKARYQGTAVGASESIFSMLAPALGLDLITPPSFLRAISEGDDVSPADKATIDDQIRRHLIRIYVYNVQNTTPDVQAQLRECRADGVPTVVITETLAPAGTTYQAWQVRQLQAILEALQTATAT